MSDTLQAWTPIFAGLILLAIIAAIAGVQAWWAKRHRHDWSVWKYSYNSEGYAKRRYEYDQRWWRNCETCRAHEDYILRAPFPIPSPKGR